MNSNCDILVQDTLKSHSFYNFLTAVFATIFLPDTVKPIFCLPATDLVRGLME
jgi:hypothetical protein